MFRGVLFDLDGVITDTAEYHFLAWKALADDLGISIDRQLNEKLKGVSREDSLKTILKFGNKENSFSSEEFAALMKRKNDLYVTMIQHVSPTDVYPGIQSLLDELHHHKIKIALASASKNGPTLLKKMEIEHYFDTVVDPSSLKAGKPAPDIFIAAANQLHIPVSECIGIEDSLAGIQAIKASGAFPIGVGDSENLGKDITLVKRTSYLSFDFLSQTWKKNATTAKN